MAKTVSAAEGALVNDLARLGGELRRMLIRHPDLDRPHPLGPQGALAMLPHLAAVGGTTGGLGIRTWGGFRFHGGITWGDMSW